MRNLQTAEVMRHTRAVQTVAITMQLGHVCRFEMLHEFAGTILGLLGRPHNFVPHTGCLWSSNVGKQISRAVQHLFAISGRDWLHNLLRVCFNRSARTFLML